MRIPAIVRSLCPGFSPRTSLARNMFDRRVARLGLIAAGILCFPHAHLARAQTSVMTWHYNNARTSANLTEAILTPSNVNVNTFGKLFEKPVDGFIVGQPLYLPNVTIPGKGIHNVVYVATMHDTVYAFDADNPNLSALWTTTLLSYSPAGATTVPVNVKGCAGTVKWTETGVVSTPVISRSNQAIYLVAETYENGKVVHRLHALNFATGQPQSGSPATIQASYTLNGITSTFKDTHQMNRPGLLLVNGHIYIAFGSSGCNGANQGWIMSYNATTLQQTGAIDLEPGTHFASVWQKGAGISADSSGSIYAETAEGPVVAGTNFGSSVVKLAQHTSTLTVSDWFTPCNWQFLFNNDLDLDTGVTILPTQPGAHPYELIGSGKTGTIYLLDRTAMGNLCTYCTTANVQIVQELPAAVGSEPGTAIYWNSRVYFTGATVVRMFSLNNGMLETPPLQSAFVPNGGQGIITANGNTNGIIWNLSANAVLWAMDAQTLKVLYTSRQAPNGRDTVPAIAHFATCIAADGKVFLGTQTSLVVFGLL